MSEHLQFAQSLKEKISLISYEGTDPTIEKLLAAVYLLANTLVEQSELIQELYGGMDSLESDVENLESAVSTLEGEVF